MRYLFIIFSFLLFSVVANAQSQHWNLYINKTKKLSASVDTLQEIRLSKQETGVIKFKFPDRSKEFRRTVIIMNGQRTSVLENDMKPSCKTASFKLNELLSKTEGNPFTIYIRDIPSDPQKAMLVRIAPVAICKATWRD